MNNVVLLSGGVDSAFVATELCDHGESTRALFVDYGQPAAASERTSAKRLCEFLNITLFEFRIDGVPLGDMASSEGARVVPARNLWLISLAASLLPVVYPPIRQVGFSHNQVWIGAAPQDHAEYADCRDSFLESMRRPLHLLGHDLRWSFAKREERVNLLKGHGLLAFTHSCYSNVPCGECPSCLQ